MIIREREKKLILITQPDHAEIAGIFADHWKVTAFMGFDRLEETLFAVREHDRCWEKADHTPLLNIETGVPYSFDDHPDNLKIGLYRKGIDEMEKLHPYAALLLSRHFAWFFSQETAGAGLEYYRSEVVRQQKLLKQLDIQNKELEEVEFHFRLLQFCDNLSLFICLNEEGENRHPWFKNGIPNSEKLGLGKKLLKASWQKDGGLRVTRFPFDEPFTVRLKYRTIPTPLQDQESLDRLWKKAEVQTKDIRIVP